MAVPKINNRLNTPRIFYIFIKKKQNNSLKPAKKPFYRKHSKNEIEKCQSIVSVEISPR